MQEGYGAKLIRTPSLIKDIVRQTVSRVPGLPVSIKIRIHDDARYTATSFPGSLVLEEERHWDRWWLHYLYFYSVEILAISPLDTPIGKFKL